MYHKKHIEFEHGVYPKMTPRFYKAKYDIAGLGTEDVRDWARKHLDGACEDRPFEFASLQERLGAIAQYFEPVATASRWEVDPDRLKGEDFWKAQVVDDDEMLFAVLDAEGFRAIVEDVPERVQGAVNCCESTSDIKYLIAEIEEIAEIYRELSQSAPAFFVAYFDNGGDERRGESSGAKMGAVLDLAEHWVSATQSYNKEELYARLISEEE